MSNSKLIRSLLLATTTWSFLTAATAAAQSRVFNITAQPASDGIAEFARQSGLQVIAAGDEAAGQTIQAVAGDMDARAALKLMLASTDLKVASDDGRTVVLKSEKKDTGLQDGMEVVVVSARRILERAQDVPLPISTLGRDQLSLGSHYRLEELNQLIPNANFMVQNGHQTSLSIRGLGTLPGNDGIEGSAGVFLDGVYLGRPGMVAMDLMDINQIEVLRGPQGTLYGKNTTAGAINITTAKPSFDPELTAAATYGNYDFQQYQLSATGGLIDNLLAVRLTAYGTWRDGWVKNIDGNRLNTLGRQGARGQLWFEPNDRFNVRIIGEYAREQQSTGGLPLMVAMGSTPDAIQKKLTATGATLIAVPSGRSIAIDGPYGTGTRQWAVSAEANWRLNGITLTSITAFRHWTYRSMTDADGSTADAINAGAYVRDDQITQELRAAFSTGAVDTVAGLYYFHQDMYFDGTAYYGADAAAWLSGISNALLPAYAKKSPTVAALLAYNGTRWDTMAKPHATSYSAFGQSVWHVSDSWNVTAGARATFEYKNQTIWRPNPVVTATGATSAVLASQTTGPMRATLSNAAPSFLISSDYRFSSALMAYALVSQGQKAGGINASLPVGGASADSLKFKPETATNYELGIKSDPIPGRFTLNANLFWTDVTNYQATYYAVVNNTIVSQVTNVGKVRTAGVETEATATLFEGLTLRFSGAFDRAFYRSYPNGPCAPGVTGICNLTGRPVANTPEWNVGISGSYIRTIGWGLSGYAAGEYSWRSHYYGNLDDSAQSRIGNTHLANMRVGIRSDDGHWDLSLWGKNLLDEHVVNGLYSYSSILPGAYVASVGDPLTFGITLKTNL